MPTARRTRSAVAGQATLRRGDRPVVEVDGVDGGGAELVEDQPGAVSAAAADLQDALAWHPAAQAGQQRRLVAALQRPAGQGVDQHRLDLVH